VEEERLARLEAEQEAAAAAEERLRCQLCSVRAGTRLQLLEHYSGQHLAADLATSFADLGIPKAMKVAITVLGFRDILVLIRIPRSVPLTNGSGSGSNSRLP
jgi:hypothetical protein